MSRVTIVGSSTISPSVTRRSASTQHGGVEHALLEQVADPLHAGPPAAASRSAAPRTARAAGRPRPGALARIAVAATRPSSVCVGGIRMSSDDRVGARRRDEVEQRDGVLRLRDDLDARIGEQADDAVPGEQQVLDDDHAHGSSTCRLMTSVGRRRRLTVPPTAPTRSSSAVSSGTDDAPSISRSSPRCPSAEPTRAPTRPSAPQPVGRADECGDDAPRRGLHLGREPDIGRGVDLDRDRRLVGERLERRQQPRLGERRRMDPARQPSQRLDGGVRFLDRRGRGVSARVASPASTRAACARLSSWSTPSIRCCAPSWRSRSIACRAASPVSTIRARDARSSRTSWRTAASRRSLAAARRTASPRSSPSGTAGALPSPMATATVTPPSLIGVRCPLGRATGR